MKFGVHTCVDGNLTSQIDSASKMGLTCFQMFVGPTESTEPYVFDAADVEEFKLRKQREQMGLVVHANFVTNIAYSGPGNRYKFGISCVHRQLQVADQLGADFFVLHPGSFKAQSEQEGIQNVVTGVRELLARGFNGKLLLEAMPGGGTQVGKLWNLLKIMEALGEGVRDHVGICLDTAHVYAQGVDLTRQEVRDEVFLKAGPYVDVLHLNMPDPNVVLGKHLDRHAVSWLHGRWDASVMLSLARQWDSTAKCAIMEAAPEAYSVNLMLLEEAGL